MVYKPEVLLKHHQLHFQTSNNKLYNCISYTIRAQVHQKQTSKISSSPKSNPEWIPRSFWRQLSSSSSSQSKCRSPTTTTRPPTEPTPSNRSTIKSDSVHDRSSNSGSWTKRPPSVARWLGPKTILRSNARKRIATSLSSTTSKNLTSTFSATSAPCRSAKRASSTSSTTPRSRQSTSPDIAAKEPSRTTAKRSKTPAGRTPTRRSRSASAKTKTIATRQRDWDWASPLFSLFSFLWNCFNLCKIDIINRDHNFKRFSLKKTV